MGAGDLLEALAVEGVVAVYEEGFFALEGAVGGGLDGEGGFACFFFAVNKGEGGFGYAAVEDLIYASAACWDVVGGSGHG